MNEPAINTSDQGANSSESRKSSLPRPEDVPAGEPWIVLCGGRKWVGVRADDHGYYPWGIIRTDGIDYQDVADSEITLISRLVPERKENVSLHPDKFPGEECRFMHPPECYCGE